MSGKATLVLRIHGYLHRYGFINYGMFQRVNPMHGELAPPTVCMYVCMYVQLHLMTSLLHHHYRQDAIQGGGHWGWGQWSNVCQAALLLWSGCHCH